jgi:glucuronosyltransferase
VRRVFREAGGVDRAADLVEHYTDVGYDHLVPAYAKYNWSWVQYHNVDVHAVILLTLVLTALIVVKLCQCVCWNCCRKFKTRKSKVD